MPKSSGTIASGIDRWTADPVLFAHEHFLIAASRRPIELLPHRQRILRALFTPPYPTEAVYSTIKKSGKTAIGVLVALIVAVCFADEGTEIIVLANDEEQAVARVFHRHGGVIATSLLFLPTRIQRQLRPGGVAEWSNAAVLKTMVAIAPG